VQGRQRRGEGWKELEGNAGEKGGAGREEL